MIRQTLLVVLSVLVTCTMPGFAAPNQGSNTTPEALRVSNSGGAGTGHASAPARSGSHAAHAEATPFRIVSETDADAAAELIAGAKTNHHAAGDDLVAPSQGNLFFFAIIGIGIAGSVGVLLWHRLGYLNRMPVNAKLYVGMGMLIALTLGIGLEGMLFHGKLNKQSQTVALAGELELRVEQAAKDNYQFRTLVLSDAEKASKIEAEHAQRVSEVAEIFAELVAHEQHSALADVIEEFSVFSVEYADEFGTLAAKYHEIADLRDDVKILADKLLYELEAAIHAEMEAHDRLIAQGASAERVLEYTELIAALERVEIWWVRTINELANYLLDHDTDHIREMETDLGHMMAALRSVEHINDSFTSGHQSAQIDSVVALAREDAHAIAEATAVIFKDEAAIKAASIKSSNALHKMETDGLAILDFASARVHATEVAASRISILMLVSTVAVGLLICFVLSDSIIRPIRLLVTRIETLAAGDFTDRIEVDRTDEFGRLAKAYNTASEQLGSMISDVSGAAHEVAGAATQIAATSEQMAAGLDNQEQQTNESSAAVEQLSSSVASVADKSAHAAEAAANAGHEAEEGGKVVAGTITEIQGIAEQVRASVQAVDALGVKSEAIGEIIAVINDIADQTNLLALNAAIEAARAGEHGRGFAVVADEVRKLAERTTTATEQVSRSIREIQDDTKTAIAQIEQGSSRVENGVQMASDAGGSLERIVDASQTLRSMVDDIAHAIEEQKIGAQQIAQATTGIVQVTQESSSAANEANAAAANLSQQAERLLSMTSQFNV